MKQPKKALVKNSVIDFSPNSLKILEKRYLLKDENGVVAETVEGMFTRVANVVAAPDAAYGYEGQSQIEFYNLLSSKKFFPNSPTFTGAGTPLGQLAACFVLPIEDDLGKHPDGIFSTLRNAALIQQVGGGNGFSFSDLRPKGALVKSSMGRATGPVGFLSVYDKAFGEVAQGGVRRGANMAVLRVDHPDIRDFIKCKGQEGEITNFNISVAVTDEFMQAVKEDKKYDLIDPHTKKVVESPRAREIFDMMVEYAYKNGEPGVLFIDEANRHNPVPHLYELKATNPCGEQWLGPYENCCLGSINLLEHLDKKGQVDWDSLRDTIILSTRFLDNVVTANKYVEAVPQLKKAAENCRRIGLGFMGLADVMYSIGVRYGSEAGLDFAGQVTEFIRYHAMLASIELAKERGPFPAIKGSIYDPKDIKWTPPKPIKPFRRDFGRPEINWEKVLLGIKKYGIRNAAQTTVAPTGTISTVAGVEGYGCEPVFALAYYRNVYQAAGDKEKLTLTYVSPLFEKAINSLNLKDEVKNKIIEKVLETGSCQKIQELPEKIRDVFVVSSDIFPEEHVKMQAAIQAFIDNSISKTCNFPSDAKKEDVAKVYMLGWELKCKGLTVYVTGSRQEVVLETKEIKDKKSGKSETAPVVKKEVERGYRLSGTTYKVDTPQGRAFITVNKDEDGNPLEVFANVGKAGSDVAALSEALGRLISGWLRVSENPLATAREIVSQLLGIGGSRSVGFGNKRVSSIPDAVAKVIAEDCDIHIKTNGATSIEFNADKKELPTLSNVNVCPECGNASFIYEEGCSKCYECGYSVC